MANRRTRGEGTAAVSPRKPKGQTPAVSTLLGLLFPFVS